MTQPAIEHESVQQVASPGLDQFRTNPFRMLRLATSVSSQQALWQGEKALSRIRVGMSLPDPDPVPWLAPATELEIMDGMHTMESPLARLVEQLLWFDFEADPRGAALRDALRAADPARLGEYWMQIDETPVVHRFNQLNLRLLIAFSGLRKVGPELLARGDGTLAANWRKEGRLSVLDDVHALIRAGDAKASSWADLLADTLRAYGRMLASPEALAYVQERIAALGDDMLSADDADAVISAVRTRLADLVVSETKVELQRGLIENVALLADLAAKSEMDSEIWLVAFKPLRTQFQSELAALEPDASTGAGPLADIAAYLDRLTSLVDRWKRIDRTNILGLGTMIDEAVGEAFGRLRNLDNKHQRDPKFAAQLEQIGQLAVSNSVRDRVTTFKERLSNIQDSLCHFCQQRDSDADHCGYVAGKNYQYVRGAPVARCEPCARNHRLIYRVGRVAFWCVAASALLFAMLMPQSSRDSWMYAIVGIGAAFFLGWAGRLVASSKLTPKGHRAFNEYRESGGARFLGDNGVHEMRYDGSYTAAADVRRRGISENDADGPFGSVMRVLGRGGTAVFNAGGLRFVVVIILLGLKFCIVVSR